MDTGGHCCLHGVLAQSFKISLCRWLLNGIFEIYNAMLQMVV